MRGFCGGGAALGIGLERDHREGDPEDLGHLLAEQSVLVHLVTRPTQSSAHDLLAEQLRHERPQADDVGDRAAIPALGKHAHADDAPHVSTGWVEGAIELLGQFLEAVGVDRPALAIARPVGLAHGVEGEPHPPRLVALGLAGVGLVHLLGVHADRIDRPVAVAERVDLYGWDARRGLVLGEPFVDDLGDRRVLADQNEHRRAGFAALGPLRGRGLPEPAQHGDRGVRPLEDRLGLGIGSLAAALGRGQLGQDPVPDVEVTRDRRPGRVADRELGNLDQPRLDGVDQAEVAHDPRERPVGLLPDPAKEVRGCREVDADVDATELLDAVQPVDPDRRLLLERLGVFLVFKLLVEQFSLLIVGGLPLDPVGVVGLVVHHEDVLLPAHLAADDPVDQCGIALDALLRLHENLLEVPGIVPVLP